MCGKDFFFFFGIFCFCWSSLCLGSAGLLNLGVHVFSPVRKFVLFLFSCLSLSSFSMPIAFILFHDRKASDTDIDLLTVLRTPTLLHTSSFLPACDVLRPVFKFQGSFCCLIYLLRLSIKFFLKNLIYWYFWKIIIQFFFNISHSLCIDFLILIVDLYLSETHWQFFRQMFVFV